MPETSGTVALPTGRANCSTKLLSLNAEASEAQSFSQRPRRGTPGSGFEGSGALNQEEPEIEERQLRRRGAIRARPHGEIRARTRRHIDLKYLPALRNARNDFEFAAVDDFSREAVVSIGTEPDERSGRRLYRARRSRLCRTAIEAVLTDNAFAFTMRHARYAEADAFQQACAASASVTTAASLRAAVERQGRALLSHDQ